MEPDDHPHQHKHLITKRFYASDAPKEWVHVTTPNVDCPLCCVIVNRSKKINWARMWRMLEGR